MDSYLKALRDKHSAIQAEIDAEYARPCPETLVLSELKRSKLRLREKLHRLEAAVRVADRREPLSALIVVDAPLSDRATTSGLKRLRKRDRLFGAIGAKYRFLKGRISELLARHDGDYSELSAASQELGFLQRALRNRIARLRAKKRMIRQATAT